MRTTARGRIMSNLLTATSTKEIDDEAAILDLEMATSAAAFQKQAAKADHLDLQDRPQMARLVAPSPLYPQECLSFQFDLAAGTNDTFLRKVKASK